jgi:glycosyltransferase involved in cell wall biosynthesis
MTAVTRSPTVSVIMPSFNHGRFIASAIASVLTQTISDLELVVVDDGSSDRSADIISGIVDPRVRHVLLERNGGACEAMNIGLRMATGRFIAVCNSDDEWHPDKLELQLKLLQDQTSAVAIFSDVVWIDDYGAPLDGRRAPSFEAVFSQENRSRRIWIRDLLETGNRLCHPSLLIRRDVYDAVGRYDNRLRQLPDLDLWIRTLNQFDIFVTPARLVRFRVHKSNTSAVTPEVSRRSLNEHRLILRKTIVGMSGDDFVRAFGFKADSIDDALDLRIEKALYLLAYEGIYRGMFHELGLDLLFETMNESVGIERLSTKYGFGILDLQREMAVHSPWIADTASESKESVQQQLSGFRSIDLAESIISRYRKKIRRKIVNIFGI